MIRPHHSPPPDKRQPAQQTVDETFTLAAGALLLSAIVFVYMVQSILLPFVLAGVAAYICTPLIDAATKRTSVPRAVWALITFVAIVTIVVAFISLTFPELSEGAVTLVGRLQDTISETARQFLGDRTVLLFGQPMNSSEIANIAIGGLRDWITQGGHIGTIAATGAASLFGGFLTAVLFFYFLLSGPGIGQALLWLVPPRRRTLVAAICATVDPLLKRYFIGMFVVVLYATAAAYLGLGLILGIRHALLLAIVTGCLEAIPVIGPLAAIVVASLAAMRAAHGPWDLFNYAVYATVLRLSIDQLIGPLVLGTAVRVHPVLVIFCFLVGGTVFGVAGIILAIPIALVVRCVLAMLYRGPAFAPETTGNGEGGPRP
jgi:predicted PurR-regulated permease PerM